ncbi:MAG: DUF2252 domain-containing protein [Bacteriovoracaceae bacterium]|nr:DUF2252 domain-containing protein [Bacteriovoracaceae bacterium]
MEEYLKKSEIFEKRLHALGPMSEKAKRYLFFRMIGPLMQSRLERVLNLSHTPRVLLHGNPHLDNYVRTFRGSALLDFDRSRIGPYSWDIIRFLASLSLRREEDKGFLDRDVVEYFIDGYFSHFINPEVPFKQIRMLKKFEPQKWQTNTFEYLKSNRKWAKKMRQFPVSKQGDLIKTLLKSYLESRNELSLLQEYSVDEVGVTPGTLGKKHYIYSLIPKNRDSLLDSVMIDIKEVYAEKDTRYFISPWPHHGIRMIEASRIYADGMEQRLGYATVGGRQYWGRQIPSFAAKVKKFLNEDEQKDVAYSIGSQLGKGHRKSVAHQKVADEIIKDFQLNFDRYLKVARLFALETKLAYDFTCAKNRLLEVYKEW